MRQLNSERQPENVVEKELKTNGQQNRAAETPAKQAKKSRIGGQALIEGVMMRGLDKTSMAVRIPDGSIDLETWESGSLANPKWYRKIPFVRGCVNMVESLVLGYKCLMKSADKVMVDELEDGPVKEKYSDEQPENEPELDVITKQTNEQAENGPEQTVMPDDKGEQELSEPDLKEASGVPQGKDEKQKKSGSTAVISVVAMVLGVGIALLLFMYLPMLVVNAISNFVNLGIWKTAIEGVIKIAIFVCYLAAMSLLKDTRRTFEYHGAEHKSIACYEAGETLTVENVKKYRRFHPRCGTSFLIIVLIISILVMSVATWNSLWMRLVIKIALLPVVVGISYEIIRLAGKYDNVLTRIISAPGIRLQHLTTKEPDDSQIEVAIAALNAVIPEDRDSDEW